jgi:hypothetical protein
MISKKQSLRKVLREKLTFFREDVQLTPALVKKQSNL